MILSEKPVEKLSEVNQSTTDDGVIANYDLEMTTPWDQHHEPDLKEPVIKSWRSREEGSG